MPLGVKESYILRGVMCESPRRATQAVSTLCRSLSRQKVFRGLGPMLKDQLNIIL